MSKKRNRNKTKNCISNREYRVLQIKFIDVYYPYDGEIYWKNNMPNHKYRSYKTWKHNRKKQWKVIK